MSAYKQDETVKLHITEEQHWINYKITKLFDSTGNTCLDFK